MDFSKMNKAEIEQIMEEAKKRIDELKNAEAMELLNNLRPKSFVRISKGKRGEKIGKVLMIGDEFIILMIQGEKPWKMKVEYTKIDEVFSNEEDALDALKVLENKKAEKKEEEKPVEKKTVFGKKK